MRVFVMVGLVGATFAAPADACPQGARCIAMLTTSASVSSVRVEQAVSAPAPAPAPPRKISLELRVASPSIDRLASLRSSLSTFEPPVRYAGDIEMPALWAVVATEVRNHLPRYEDEDQFSMVLSPVVVTMPTETTPGLGLSGDF